MDPKSLAESFVAGCLDASPSQWQERIDRAIADHPELAKEIADIYRALATHGFVGRPRRPEVPGYSLLEVLGGGGMGDVWRAREDALSRVVALKLIRRDTRLSPGILERFQREMRTLSGLRHPGIVRLLSSGVAEGVPYYTMELLDGVTLATVVARLEGKKPSDLTSAVLLDEFHCHVTLAGGWMETCFRIVAQVARALDHAHREGVLHRDIKPANIMLTREGRPVLIDFGLALDTGDVRLTRTGLRLGSLPYLAPELWAHPGSHSRRSEVYSLGLVLYELLTLRVAFRGESEERLREAILNGPGPSLAAVHQHLSKEAGVVCLTSVAHDPGDRYSDCRALADDLEAVLSLRPIAARRPGVARRSLLLIRRRPAATALILAGITILILLTVAFVASKRVEDRLRDEWMQDRRLSAKWALDTLSFLTFLSEKQLWPIAPDKVGAYRFWIAQADALLDYMRVVSQRNASNGMDTAIPKPVIQDASAGPQYFLEQEGERDRDLSVYLTESTALLPYRSLEKSRALLMRCEQAAATIQEISVGSSEATAAWRKARADARSCGLYGDLDLDPQMGLFPIGTDAGNGRLLFWVVTSGARPDPEHGRTSLSDPTVGIVLELVPAGSGVSHPFFMACEPATNAVWQRYGWGVPPELAESTKIRVGVSFKEAFIILGRQGLRLPRPEEWNWRFGDGSLPGGVWEWVADEGNTSPAIMPAAPAPHWEQLSSKQMSTVTLASESLGVRAARDIEESQQTRSVEYERQFQADSFEGWRCGCSAGNDSGAAWILRDGGGNPGACMETVTYSGRVFLLCYDPRAEWNPAIQGAWNELDLCIDCRSLLNWEQGEAVLPVVEQCGILYVGTDRNRVMGRIPSWHNITASRCAPGDFMQALPRDWQRDPTVLERGPSPGPDVGPEAQPMHFGFGIFAGDKGVSRAAFDNWSVTVRRRGPISHR
ncbi:MAG: serine/threonine-protein kinase [Planctomycetota bacterium]